MSWGWGDLILSFDTADVWWVKEHLRVSSWMRRHLRYGLLWTGGGGGFKEKRVC